MSKEKKTFLYEYICVFITIFVVAFLILLFLYPNKIYETIMKPIQSDDRYVYKTGNESTYKLNLLDRL